MSAFLDAFEAQIHNHNINLFNAGIMSSDGIPRVRHWTANNPCQNVYSVAKAFTVTAVGLLVDRGQLSVDEIITDVLKDDLPENCESIWYSTTLDMLLRHQVALPAGFLDIDCEDASAWGDDYLKHILTYPITPGAVPSYCYTDAAFYLLSRAVETRAGISLDNFLWKELFLPFQCREAAWSHCPKGHAMGATGLYIRTEDMLKLGRLYLNNGTWQGQRLLSKTWVDTVRTRGYELKRIGIGESFGKGGMLGQMLLVIPEADLVAAWQGYVTDPSWDPVRWAAEFAFYSSSSSIHSFSFR